MVFHPARRLAPSHDVHDHSPWLVCLFSDWLCHLSCARWRKIVRIHRMARCDLFSDPGLARSARFCDAPTGHFDACSGFSAPMGPAQTDCALDHPDLALRVSHRSSRLFNALPMVPSAGALSIVESAVFKRITWLRTLSTCAEDSARCSDEPANQSDLKILRSTAI